MAKVLSLLQPWATLAVMGFKTIETRTWTSAYRSPLLIHASKGKAGAAFAGTAAISAHIPDFKALPFGAIIGEVCLVDIVRVSFSDINDPAFAASSLEESAFGPATGKWAWIFSDAVAWEEHIPATGRTGLWEW